MSEEEAAEDGASEVDSEEIEEEAEPETTEGQPSVADEEQADLSGIGDVDPEEIEDSAGAGEQDDQADTESEESNSADASPSESDTEMAPEASAGEWGEMYVSVCQTATNAIIKKHGDGEEVEKDHFTDTVPLDEYFNMTMQEMVGDSEMPPQQALVVGTMLAVGGPVAMHTDLMEQMAGNIDADAFGGGAA